MINNKITLTPNRRLAATLIKQSQQLNIQQNQTCWPTLSILPLTSWLENLWITYLAQEITQDLPILLTHQQEMILWEEIIRASPFSENLLQVSQTAKLASAAWGLLKQWKINFLDIENHLTEENYLFQQWAKEYKKILLQKNKIDHASLPDLIISAMKTQKIIPPSTLLLNGFIEISPQIQYLLDLCQEQGCIIINEKNQSINQTTQIITATDQENEIFLMARWAKSLYENNLNTPIKIACIFPQLEQCRNQVQRIFEEVFFEHKKLSSDIFNISAGKKLTNCPIIYTAFKLLHLSTAPLALSEFSHLLRSPFLGEAEKEGQKRARYESYLRYLNKTTLLLSELIKEDYFQFSNYSPRLKKRLKKYLNQLPSPNTTFLPSEWAVFFNEALFLLGWPGERSLNSQEFQMIQNGWLPLLNEFSKLDTILPPLKHSNALYYLRQLADHTLFQPKTPETPIQLLGILEAAGLVFDYTWVMGLDDTIWPAMPSPNPFIPLSLQKKLNMPHASADRELLYCRQLTQQLIDSSKTILFSYAIKKEQSTQHPSALIKLFPQTTSDALYLKKFIPHAHSIFQEKKIELIEDTAPPLMEYEKMAGGSRLFKLQAACPFKAFAELRLNARPIDIPITGLRPQDRGKLLHKVVEIIGKELDTSTKLNILNTDELKNKITLSVDQAFTDLSLTKYYSHAARYLLIEKKRTEKIIDQWLELEKKCPYFKIISLEQAYTINIANHSVTLRIDRIDDIGEGNILIIDYKTGKNNSINHWFGERLDEPQLPLYCMTAEFNNNITGISFAELHPDIIGLKGISKKSLDITTIQSISSWEKQLQQWKIILTQLGNDFHQGIALVDPKKKDETCRQCHLQNLCRINESCT